MDGPILNLLLPLSLCPPWSLSLLLCGIEKFIEVTMYVISLPKEIVVKKNVCKININVGRAVWFSCFSLNGHVLFFSPLPFFAWFVPDFRGAVGKGSVRALEKIQRRSGRVNYDLHVFVDNMNHLWESPAVSISNWLPIKFFCSQGLSVTTMNYISTLPRSSTQRSRLAGEHPPTP